jgi:oligopeptide/dipeptide ABC transporter ATP-binding protein
VPGTLRRRTQALLSAIPDAAVAQASSLWATGKPALSEVEGMPVPPRRRERIRIEGDVPSPSSPPPGCHFHPRCRHAMPVCRETYPPETRLGSGRIVRCHLHGH